MSRDDQAEKSLYETQDPYRVDAQKKILESLVYKSAGKERRPLF